VCARALRLSIASLQNPDNISVKNIPAIWNKHKEKIMQRDTYSAILKEFQWDDNVINIWQQSLFKTSANDNARVTHPSPLLQIMTEMSEFIVIYSIIKLIIEIRVY